MEKSKVSKKTVVIGASTNKERYAYTVADMLEARSIDFVPVGIKKGEVFGKEILDLREMPQIEKVHTVTLYLSPKNQEEWIDYILSLNPKRIIFNPGTENPDFIKLAQSNGIDAVVACNLVLLSTGQF